MGNGKSQPIGLVIEEKSIESGNFWSLHPATFGSQPSKRVTVFVGPSDASDSTTTLEKYAKNLMIYRHPNILKYVASWKVNGQFHLATEEVQPLSQVIKKLTPLQTCIGLHCILKALTFLHEKASSLHCNVCQAAVYVTAEGHWKLGGLEYLCQFKSVTASYLSESRNGRYERGISPGESKTLPQPVSSIDVFAFGILAEELLSKLNVDVPGLTDFVELCRNNLQAGDCSARPPFQQLFRHLFFSHEFIQIYDFLVELPLKTEPEKQIFFSSLLEKLRGYDEQVVARQMGGLLLSRLVLLDSTAQHHLIPHLLAPKDELHPDSLFTETVYRSDLVPRLMSIFCVRDLQVRMTLLLHFSSFCYLFTLNQMQSILPEILVGIKDQNDSLVSATLKSLADLVPLMGSATVIGGKRMKLFSDGRPKQIDARIKLNPVITPSLQCETGGELEVEVGLERVLSERHSPDGGEAPAPTTLSSDGSTHDWPLWDCPTSPPPHSPTSSLVTSMQSEETFNSPSQHPQESSTASGNNFPELVNLDLKVIEVKQAEEQMDFFSDMEPVISRANILEVASGPPRGVSPANKFNATNSESDVEGWGDDLLWADISQDTD